MNAEQKGGRDVLLVLARHASHVPACLGADIQLVLGNALNLHRTEPTSPTGIRPPRFERMASSASCATVVSSESFDYRRFRVTCARSRREVEPRRTRVVRLARERIREAFKSAPSPPIPLAATGNRDTT